jgi:hypothetical protein
MQENWRIFSDDLQGLLRCFRSFYTLAPHEITAAYEKIGGSARDVGDGANRSVHDRVSLALDPWFIDVLKLVDTGDWAEPAEKGWEGPAAETFQQTFLDPFHRMAEIQLACVRELSATAWGWSEAVDTAGKQLLEIADACIYRMQNPAGFESTDVHILSLSSIAAGIAAFYPPIALPFGVVSVLTAVVTYFDFVNKELEPDLEVEIGGTTPHATVLSTIDAVKAVEAQLITLDDGIAAALNEDLTRGLAFDHPSIRLPQSSSSGLRHGLGRLNVGSVAGVPLSEDVVVTSIVQVYRAGTTNLPIIADQYAAAASILDGCKVTGGIYRFMARSAGRYDTARGLLVDALTNTSARSTEVGEALVQTANDYQLTDDRRAEVLRQISLLQRPYVGDEPPRAGGV